MASDGNEINRQSLQITDFNAQNKDNLKQVKKYAQRMVISRFVDHLTRTSNGHVCCGTEYTRTNELYRHINTSHAGEIQSASNTLQNEGSEDAKWKLLRKKTNEDQKTESTKDDSLPQQFDQSDSFPWLPSIVEDLDLRGDCRILLFYKYCDIPDTGHVKSWQESLCSRLHLTGKVRVASEGLNGTVSGSVKATEIYMAAILKHPYFTDMTREQFKTSEGTKDAFPDGLRVGIHEEAVPMGVKPDDISYKDAGVHLSPEQFHQAMAELKDQDKQKEAVVIDCRNFYESKIGRFDGAVTPDIRKFSYWPEYVDKNKELFEDKKVYMYCTGGIRCERGSAYLKAKGLGREVYQLEGGIHEYAEKYPNGLFKGKLFVFDNRYAMPVNGAVLSECVYCYKPWDDYSPCSSRHCHQLVLSCSECKSKGRTACCVKCQENHDTNKLLQECDCTRHRQRVAKEPLPNYSTEHVL